MSRKSVFIDGEEKRGDVTKGTHELGIWVLYSLDDTLLSLEKGGPRQVHYGQDFVLCYVLLLNVKSLKFC